ncbi:Eukaryotic peptide chain release factor subunit 1, partial [Galemys pyrenaicus]
MVEEVTSQPHVSRLQHTQLPEKRVQVSYLRATATQGGRGNRMGDDPSAPQRRGDLCNNKLHAEAQLPDASKFGFIVMDSSGALFFWHTPGKSERGPAQILCRSPRRTWWRRTGKSHNYVQKVAEAAVPLFIFVNKMNVIGHFLPGSADFKAELSQFDPFASYGGENGFNQAIELSTEVLSKINHKKDQLVKRLGGTGGVFQYEINFQGMEYQGADL